MGSGIEKITKNGQNMSKKVSHSSISPFVWGPDRNVLKETLHNLANQG